MAALCSLCKSAATMLHEQPPGERSFPSVGFRTSFKQLSQPVSNLYPASRPGGPQPLGQLQELLLERQGEKLLLLKCASERAFLPKQPPRKGAQEECAAGGQAAEHPDCCLAPEGSGDPVIQEKDHPTCHELQERGQSHLPSAIDVNFAIQFQTASFQGS